MAPGNLRVDDVLTWANGFTWLDGYVVWPPNSDPYSALTSFPTSDHRMVWADVKLTAAGRSPCPGPRS